MSRNLDWRGVLRAEEDPGFQKHVSELTTRGLRVLGLLGPSAVTLYVILHLLRGQPLALQWGLPGHTVVWDKLLILLLSGSLVWLAGTDVGRRAGRWLAVAIAVVAAVASVADDLMNGNARFSSAWVALFMIVTGVALPLKPGQILALAVGSVLAFAVPITVFVPDILLDRSQFVFLLSVAVCMVVVSSMLYRARLAEYTARKQVEALSEALSDKADRLERFERLKSRFFTGITHDIRTPLSLVLGPVGDLLGQHGARLDEGVRAPLAIAYRNAQRLRKLTDDLLDLAQLEAGRLQLHLRPYRIGDLLRRSVLDLQPLAERRGVVLRFIEPDAGNTLTVQVDADRMDQVVQNLVSNAIAHTAGGGRVTVAVQVTPEDEIRLDVTDTGTGISADQLPLLFDRFHRGPDEEHRATGHGLGLAIVRELTELHGGRVGVVSTPGSGTTFTVYLRRTDEVPDELPPLVLETAASPDVSGPAAVPDSVGKAPEAAPHVLVVDDNPDMRAYLRMHLQGRYRISEEDRGDSALERAREDRPDLVISDVMMPGMDGFDLCRALRAGTETAAVPIVLVTARGDTAARIEGLEAGADDFLLKPFDAEALIARLENLIELRRLLAPPGRIGATEVLVESTEQTFVQRVRDVVEEHLADSNFGVDWLADEVGLSARQLQRRLRDATRLSAAGFIRMLRLGRAAQLLGAGATNVSETAWAVGFRDIDHFARLFRQTHGVPPSEYARTHQAT